MPTSRERALRRDLDRARTPIMGPLVLWASVAVVAAVAGAVALYLILAWLLRIDPHPETATAEQQRLLADMVKIALGLAAGIGAAVALIVGYRRARVDESASHRDDQRLFASRYQDAADLIGHEQAAVRLAGIYAMSRLADDWDEQRQQCIDVLCAYLRLPYDPDDTIERLRPRRRFRWSRTPEQAGDQAPPRGEREVRLTVIRIITAHLQPEAPHPWQGHDFDFTGAVFDGGDFSGAEFSRGTVCFAGAMFPGGFVDFVGAKFSGGSVTFSDAEFSGSTVFFVGAEFSDGSVTFGDAKFSGGTVNFMNAAFAGGFLEFGDAKFSGGTVTFHLAKFSGSTVYFYDAKFSGGTVNFGLAEFASGDVDFSGAEFSGGEVDLSAAGLRLGGRAPQGFPDAPIAGLKLPDWMTQTSPAPRFKKARAKARRPRSTATAPPPPGAGSDRRAGHSSQSEGSTEPDT